MPPGEEDSGDDEDTASENDSLEIATADDLIPSEEAQQEAIERVTFEWCQMVRDAGERYREDASIPEIAVELDVSMEEARRAVKMYYLVFSDAPMYKASGVVFTNGQLFFDAGVDIEGLDGETQTEAEEHVRAFVGWTLLDNELDDVDIEGSVPEMQTLSLDLPEMPDEQLLDGVQGVQSSDVHLLDGIQGVQSSDVHLLDGVQGVKASSDAWPSVSNLFFDHPGISRAFENIQRAVDVLYDRKIHERMWSSGLDGRATALASSAAISSMAASSAVAGVEPAVFQAVNEPAVQAVSQVTAELYSQSAMQLFDVATQSALEEVFRSMNSLSTFPMTPMTDVVGERFASRVAELAGQVNDIHLETVGTMGAVGASSKPAWEFGQPDPGIGFEQSEAPLTPAPSNMELDKVPESTPSAADPEMGATWWLMDRVRAHPGEIAGALSGGATDITLYHLSQMYPSQQPIIGYVDPVASVIVTIFVALAVNER
jgi:hypothetical protein